MRYTLWILLLFLPAALMAQAPDTLWTRHYGGAGDEFCHRIRATLSDGFVMVGSTTSAGAGGKDGYIFVTTQSGTPAWSQIYGGVRDDEFWDVVQLFTSEYVVAGTTHSFGGGGDDFWLMKLSSTGDSLWSHTYGGIGDQRCVALQATTDGGYILAGNSYPFMDPRADMFLVKTDASGYELWNHTIGDTANDAVAGVVQLPAGGYFMVGEREVLHGTQVGNEPYAVKTSSSGFPVWEELYEGIFPAHCTSVRPAPIGGYILGATADHYTHGEGLYTESMMIKLTADGIAEWVMACGIPYDDEVHEAAPTPDHGYVAVGSRHDPDQPLDGFMVKVNVDGDTLWTKSFGGSEDDALESVLPWYNGRCAVAGYTRSYSANHNADLWLVMLDSVYAVSADRPVVHAPDQYSLSAFPNPFNPVTEISFTVSRTQRVKLPVYDVAGRQVRLLADEVFAAGEHRLNFDGRELPTGIYFARLQAKGAVKTQKLLLLK